VKIYKGEGNSQGATFYFEREKYGNSKTTSQLLF
jgi:hypothetical protein